jgi:hypothetical protein
VFKADPDTSPEVHTFELKNSNDNLVVSGRLGLQVILSNSVVPPLPSYERSRLLDEHRRVTEQVRLWYHETATGATATNEAELLNRGSSYRVQLEALNFELSETSLSTFCPLSLAYALTNVQLLTKTRHLDK